MTDTDVLAAIEAEQQIVDDAALAEETDVETLEASGDEPTQDTDVETLEANPADADDAEPVKLPNRRPTVTSTTKPTDDSATPAVSATKPASKASRARVIFAEMWSDVAAGKSARKDVINRFEAEVGMTKAGASTYYQQFKKKMEAGEFQV